MKKRGTLMLISLLGVCITVGILTLYIMGTKNIVGTVTTPPLIRLHILANSDSAEDQELKYKVRDRIIRNMSSEFGAAQSLEESRSYLLNRLPYIEEMTEQYLAKEGYPAYQIKAVYGIFEFPLRDYGEFVLPAGKYEALRLIIGEGQGANWWCVLFPPLCFVEGEESLSWENDVEEILEQSKVPNKSIEIKPALKIVEICQELFN